MTAAARLLGGSPRRVQQLAASGDLTLRRCQTPETIVVSDLVRTRISPGHDNGPQAELAGR